VTKYQGRPVAVLGVNADDDRAAARAAAARHHLGKRSWPDGSQGPVAARWNVQCLPTVYVLDARGVVRYKAHQMRDRELADVVDALLREREAEARVADRRPSR
jgi:hypothetical protein